MTEHDHIDGYREWFLSGEELDATRTKIAALNRRAVRRGFTGKPAHVPPSQNPPARSATPARSEPRSPCRAQSPPRCGSTATTTTPPPQRLIILDCGDAVAKMITAAGWADDIHRGEPLTVTATVKAHTDYHGAPQTVLVRPNAWTIHRSPTRTQLRPAPPGSRCGKCRLKPGFKRLHWRLARRQRRA